MKVTFKRGPRLAGRKKAIEAAVMKSAKNIEDRFDGTVRTWQGDAPTFTPRDISSGGNLVIRVGPQGSKLAVNKWKWLTRGTDVRFATMTDPFTAKTSNRNFVSGPGEGGLLFVDTNRPRPGIDAREWEEEAKEQEEPTFIANVTRAVRGE